MPLAGEAVQILQRAVARFVPEQRWFPTDRPLAEAEEIWFEIPSVLRPAEQSLVVRLRGGGDIQIEYHYPEKEAVRSKCCCLVQAERPRAPRLRHTLSAI